MRHCEICGGNDLQALHRQHFLFPALVRPIHYDVVACRGCGFAFANDIPDQASLDQFYQGAEHHLHPALPDGLQQIHGDFFQFIRDHADLSTDMDVLDIGAGMGHFLQHFQRAGFGGLLGIEPSPAAVALARRTYGLEVRNATVDTFTTEKPFDLISLCGVLEHIADLRHSIRKIATLLRDGGNLFIAVPDTQTFGNVPPREAFLEFALEHINFFTATSLNNLLDREGFTRVAAGTQFNDFYGNHYLLALYRKTGVPPHQFRVDQDAAPSITAYAALSQKKLLPICERIESLVISQEPVVVWGAGGLTSRLLCDTRLSLANICTIVDRNPGLHGKMLSGITVSAPNAITEHPSATILIASTTYAAEIKTMLIEQYAWTAAIVTLVDDLPGSVQ